MNKIALPKSFPIDNYTPHGYIDNPHHSAVLNRSGIIRSVPPLGFGWWRRTFPGCYGEGPRGYLNYISFLQMSVAIDDRRFVTVEDFEKNGAKLSSRYHTKHMMSYDWTSEALSFSLKYFLPRENSLACLFEIENTGDTEKTVFIHATNVYGLWEIGWWGSDGVATEYSKDADANVSKIWAYGDVYALGANIKSIAHKATDSEKQWEKWLRENDVSSVERATVHGPGPMWAVQSYKLRVPSKGNASALLLLSRGVNELWTVEELQTAVKEALPALKKQLAKDEEFWLNCPMLEGDWPEHWKHGWVYDWETQRMNNRQPIGTYKHHWDAMQVHSPRAVLGETGFDNIMLSYADSEIARDTLLGIFADALAPNVPCSREDGSVNLICADGSEGSTNPSWGVPFRVILSIYKRTQDKKWIKNLYPYLKAYIEWWMQNKTDKDGWFHVTCSWEAQDGSRRFLLPEGGHPGDVSEYVRMVDVEAAVAEAMQNLVIFAEIAGRPKDKEYWKKLAEYRVKTTRGMFVDGWFRDFDARTSEPIVIPDYYDIMMLLPITCEIAAPEQIEAVKPWFQYFRSNPVFWLEWPSFVFLFSEAAWNAGLRTFIADVLADTADRIYPRLDAQTVRFKEEEKPFTYRVPGIANEFWPMTDFPAGGEDYGWGATLPVDIIRSLIGFRETPNLSETQFYISPAIPKSLAEPGKKYAITNLHYQKVRSKVTCEVKKGGQLRVTIEYHSDYPTAITVINNKGEKVSLQKKKKQGAVSFEGENGSLYMIKFI